MKFHITKLDNNWYSIKIEDESFVFEFYASGIPENPINNLCQNLILTINGFDTTSRFNLEPQVYILKLKINQNQYYLEIFNPKKDNSIFSKSGNFEKIILPIYRGIKKLTSINNSSEEINFEKVKKLENLVREKKSENKFQVDANNIVDWKSFHKEFRNELKFPDYYGENMDAWIDCIDDISEKSDVVIRIKNSRNLKNKNPEILKSLIECSQFVNTRKIDQGEKNRVILNLE
ncbi:barstar (barnase inhibitor) [Gramella sp. Hel_I_59]|uniref:barstar family protein n=1 Tax=unclassified Christiangramia TaxID=2615027 RepID=UPI00115386E0|nr:barstar family protein [Gramella sp. Hel_I_59]TQI71115.1 barstar (barnase inhibitor) [Gramella sp. Hel_I_59]